MHMKFGNHSGCVLESPWELAKTLIDRLHSQNRGPWCHRIYKFPNNCNVHLVPSASLEGQRRPNKAPAGPQAEVPTT